MLRASGEKEDSVSYENIPVACCKVDEAGFIVECNELFAFLLGYEADELQEMSILDLLPGGGNDIIHKVVTQSSGKLGPFSQHVWMRRKDGNSFPAILNVKLVLDEESRVRFGSMVVIDDTFNFRAIESVEKDREELRKKDRLKNEFVAIASHELRTPIQPILGFALLAKRGTIGQEEAWEGVLAEARRLQQLANDILDVSRIESDSLKYEFARVKLNELIRHTVESLASDAGKDVKIDFVHDTSEQDLIVDADRSRITQVMTNIIGNAIKFTKEGSVSIESSVKDGMVEVKVTDTGGGIPPEIQPRLFEKFATAGHGEGNKKGTGLGLYISKAIVIAHGGTITASNNDKGGSTFVVNLPVSRQKTDKRKDSLTS